MPADVMRNTKPSNPEDKSLEKRTSLATNAGHMFSATQKSINPGMTFVEILALTNIGQR